MKSEKIFFVDEDILNKVSRIEQPLDDSETRMYGDQLLIEAHLQSLQARPPGSPYFLLNISG